MPASREEAFDLWAPSASPWSVWAKPVLFAQQWEAAFERGEVAEAAPAPPSWAPRPDGATLVVADLPGALSVLLAEALVLAGFRPVPLFNALPGPKQPAGSSPRPAAIVEVGPIVDALRLATERTGRALRALPAGAPPVFLLDSARRLGHPRPGDFDNRSASLPTDFPSAALLADRGVTDVLLLVGEQPEVAQADLAHTLLRWQEAGIRIACAVVDDELNASAPRPIRVPRPRWYRALWHDALALFDLSPTLLGGFGGTVPKQSAG